MNRSTGVINYKKPIRLNLIPLKSRPLGRNLRGIVLPTILRYKVEKSHTPVISPEPIKLEHSQASITLGGSETGVYGGGHKKVYILLI